MVVDRIASRAVPVLITLGLGWRVARYALCFPFWGDEAYLNLSILHRGYGELLAPLEYAQIAPLLYLWIQRATYSLLGGGEYALRAFSLLAGSAALLLFARLAWRELEQPAATLAIGVFAVTYSLVRHTCESKPYAGDLLAATALMYCGAQWLRQPAGLQRMLVAALAAGVLIWLSYPAVFVAAGIGLTLLVAIIRRSVRRAWPGWTIYVLAVVSSFLGLYVLFAGPHISRAAGSWLEEYWADAYPPLHNPFALLWWLVRIHTGRMLAYPVGGTNFGSSLTTVLCLVGAASLVRENRRLTCLLYLAPALPTLIAAALHRYPYGDSVRVSIHLAPSVCLLVGRGSAAVLRWLQARAASNLPLGAVLLILAGIPVVGVVRDAARPYKAYEEAAARRVMRDFAGRVGPNEVVAVYNAPEGTNGPPDGPTFYQTLRLYLELYTGRPPRWRVDGGLDAQVDWLLVYRGPHFGPEPQRVQSVAEQAGLQFERVTEYPLSNRAPTALIVYRRA